MGSSSICKTQAMIHQKQLPSVVSTNDAGPLVSTSGQACAPAGRSSASLSLGRSQVMRPVVVSSSGPPSSSSAVATPSGSFRSGVLRLTPSIDAPSWDSERRDIQTSPAAVDGMVEAPPPRPMPGSDASADSSYHRRNPATCPHPAPDHIFPTPVTPPEGRSPLNDALEAPASFSRGGSPLVVRSASPTVGDVDRVDSPSEADPVAELVRLPRDNHDRPRKLLVSPSLGVLSVTMHGAVTLVDRDPPRSVRWLCCSRADRKSVV